MKKYILLAIISSVITLSGCAVQNDQTKMHGLGLTYNSNVQQLSNGDYLTEVEASLASGRIEGALALANKRAVDYCKTQDKTMKEVNSVTESHLLFNGVARLTFRCV